MLAYKGTYRRNGTLNLFGALEIAMGLMHGECTKYKKEVISYSSWMSCLRSWQTTT